MAIDFIAREAHFFEHLLPTWRALEERGTFYVEEIMLGQARAAGVDAKVARDVPPGPLTVVASYRDMKQARRARRPVALAEHGAGQSYIGVNSGSYIGARDREGVAGVLVPSERAGLTHRKAHPRIPFWPVGVPKLDRHHSRQAVTRNGDKSEPVVAIAHHWDCRICPETKSTFHYFRRAYQPLARHFKLIGHGHPRAIRPLVHWYKKAGIEPVESFDEVIERADVLIVDNSSVLYEFASLDRPVVVLNAPWYRRKVRHGLRFWDCADVGPHADKPGAVESAVRRALEDAPEVAERRRAIIRQVYVATDGRAAERAADALREIERLA